MVRRTNANSCKRHSPLILKKSRIFCNNMASPCMQDLQFAWNGGRRGVRLHTGRKSRVNRRFPSIPLSSCEFQMESLLSGYISIRYFFYERIFPLFIFVVCTAICFLKHKMPSDLFLHRRRRENTATG